MTTPPWWERHPGRLEDEIARLEAAGWAVELDEEVRAEEDRIVLHLRKGRYDGLSEARVEFPDVYPFTKPLVFSDGLELQRHYNPVTGELCLLADGTINWKATDTVAALIDDQYPQLVRAEALDPEEAAAAGLEHRAPEPARLYLTAAAMAESGIIIDFDWASLPATGGTMELAYFPDATATNDKGRTVPVVRGVVAAIRDQQGTILAEADSRLLHQRMRRGTIRWAALDQPPLGTSPEVLSDQVHRLAPTLPRAERMITHRGADGRDHEIEIVAALYVDEIGHGQYGVDAAFIGRGPSYGSNIDGRGNRHAAIRTFRAGPKHLTERVPTLSGLPAASVLQVGVGGLGAPAAHMLAQAQVGHLSLMDHDHVDPATTPRFPASIFDAGSSKAPLVAQQINAQHPYVDATPIIDMVGGLLRGRGQRQDERLEQLIADHDLVLDTTAEIGVQYLLADTCRRIGKPYVAAWGTEGAWGGGIARLAATDGHTPCFACLQATLDQEGVLPPRDEATGTLAPAGCGSLTFTGTGFDLAPLIAECARTVASTLSEDYPILGWDLAVCALRDERGTPVPPQWQAHRISCDHPVAAPFDP
jgi:molybdopterin/thiamine biosynthesis adenylyltransferase